MWLKDYPPHPQSSKTQYRASFFLPQTFLFTNNHSLVFLETNLWSINMATNSYAFLLYHVVFSTKNRQLTIHPDYRLRLYQYMAAIIKEKGGNPILINGTQDHVHILAILPRHISISESLQAVKGGSSHWYNKEFSENIPRLYWQSGYSIFSVSPPLLDKVKGYIFRQEEHHQNSSLDQELENFHTELLKYHDPAKYSPKSDPEP